MAINVRTDLACAGNWQRAPGHPAVAFIRDRTEGIWEPCCAGCIRELNPDAATYDVAYLHGHDPVATDPAADVVHPSDRDRLDHP
jgi:hypothetical protein